MTDLIEAKRVLLAEWERKRDDLTVLINALRNELGMADTQVSPDTIQQQPARESLTQGINDLVQPGDFFGQTQVGAVRALLSRTNRKAVSLSDIAAALYRGRAINAPMTDTGLRNLSSSLSRSDEFISIAKGRWGLSEWYPNAKKRRRSEPQSTEGGAETEEKAV